MLEKKTRQFRGSVTVEAAYIVPLLCYLFLLILYVLFYYHDKNILVGAGAETVAKGIETIRMHKEEAVDLEQFCQERIGKKLLLFSGVQVETKLAEEQVCVTLTAQKGYMKVQVERSGQVSLPEEEIREKRSQEKETVSENTG